MNSKFQGILPDHTPAKSTYMNQVRESERSDKVNRNTQSGNTRSSNANGVIYQDNGAQEGVEICDGHKQALILFDDIPEAKPEKEADGDNQEEAVDINVEEADEDLKQSIQIEEFSEEELLGQYRQNLAESVALIESLCAPLFGKGAEQGEEETVMLDNESLRIIEETLPLEFQMTVVTDPEDSDDSGSDGYGDDSRRGSYREMAGVYEGPGASGDLAVSRNFPANTDRPKYPQPQGNGMIAIPQMNGMIAMPQMSGGMIAAPQIRPPAAQNGMIAVAAIVPPKQNNDRAEKISKFIGAVAHYEKMMSFAGIDIKQDLDVTDEMKKEKAEQILKDHDWDFNKALEDYKQNVTQSFSVASASVANDESLQGSIKGSVRGSFGQFQTKRTTRMQSVFRRTALRETGAELYYIPEDPDDSEDEEQKLSGPDFDHLILPSIVEDNDESSVLPVIYIDDAPVETERSSAVMLPPPSTARESKELADDSSWIKVQSFVDSIGVQDNKSDYMDKDSSFRKLSEKKTPKNKAHFSTAIEQDESLFDFLDPENEGEKFDDIEVAFDEIRQSQLQLCPVQPGHQYGLVEPDFDEIRETARVIDKHCQSIFMGPLMNQSLAARGAEKTMQAESPELANSLNFEAIANQDNSLLQEPQYKVRGGRWKSSNLGGETTGKKAAKRSYGGFLQRFRKAAHQRAGVVVTKIEKVEK